MTRRSSSGTRTPSCSPCPPPDSRCSASTATPGTCGPTRQACSSSGTSWTQRSACWRAGARAWRRLMRAAAPSATATCRAGCRSSARIPAGRECCWPAAARARGFDWRRRWRSSPSTGSTGSRRAEALSLPDPGRRIVPADYHLVAGMPTPNGPTHLGHVAGPFLRMDVLARFQRLCGNRAFLVSGSDAYESHVCLTAELSGAHPRRVASRYLREIEDGLRAVDIVHDSFIDPLQPRWAGRYRRWHHRLLDRLRGLGCVVPRRELALYSPQTPPHLTGGFLAGCCPQ